MTASELLQEIRSRGIHIFPAGEQLHVGPKRALSKELITDLLEHKAEILRLLASKDEPSVAQCLGGRIAAAPPSAAGGQILTMRLDDFANAKLVMQVHSEVLGELVIIASDNVNIDPGEFRVVYRAQELRQLLGLGEIEIRLLHQAKKFYGANIHVN